MSWQAIILYILSLMPEVLKEFVVQLMVALIVGWVIKKNLFLLLKGKLVFLRVKNVS